MATHQDEHGGATANDDLGAESGSSSGPGLEIDTSNDERDSAYGGGGSTYTMSATSSVFDFRYENGRRYHAYAEGKYPVPNDETEADRLDLQHHLFRLTLDGKLYRAPIPENVQNVLDVGCGTGIWSIEFADEHPSARVLGTDLSPIQPAQVPANCEFLIDDCEADWLFHNLFDYIHTRAMVAAIKDWPRFFNQAYANMQPGGFIECQDLAFPLRCMDPGVTAENSPLMRWSDLFLQSASVIGLDGSGPRHFATKLRDAGFINVNVKYHKWPVGKWAKGSKYKLMGRYAFEDLMDWLPSSTLGLFTRVLKWSREEVEVFLAECRSEAKRKDRHYYADALFWYAQKPYSSDATHSLDLVHDEEILETEEEDHGQHAVDRTILPLKKSHAETQSPAVTSAQSAEVSVTQAAVAAPPPAVNTPLKDQIPPPADNFTFTSSLEDAVATTKSAEITLSAPSQGPIVPAAFPSKNLEPAPNAEDSNEEPSKDAKQPADK